MKWARAIKRPSVWMALGFCAFLGWVIGLANAGKDAVFFDLAKALPWGDKVGHFFLFGLLALVMNLALGGWSFALWRRAKVRVYLGSALVLVFVAVEELSQAWFPTRSCDGWDLTADVLGIAFFTWVTARVLGGRVVGLPAGVHLDA